METVIRKQAKEMMGDKKCPHDFKCVDFGFDRVFRSNLGKTEAGFKCFKDDIPICPYSDKHEDKFFCLCPLRESIAEELNKQLM